MTERQHLLGALGIIASALIAACMESDTTVCNDGRLCPADTVCDEIHRGCVRAEQLTACAALVEGAPCLIAAQPIGICADGICLRAGCGDSYVRDLEQCDGVVDLDSNDCTDHGFYAAGPVTCTSRCEFDLSQCHERCGDGTLNGNELCDPGSTGVAA